MTASECYRLVLAVESIAKSMVKLLEKLEEKDAD